MRDGDAYSEFAPPPALAGIVESVWQRDVGPGAGAIFPDGCVDFVFSERRGLIVAGPDRTPVPVGGGAGGRTTGIRLRPGIAGTVLGLPAVELSSARVDADQVLGDAEAAELSERLAEADDATRRALLIDAVAARLKQAPTTPDPIVLAAVACLGRPGARVADLADRLGVGERRLQRSFDAAVGYGPKLLDRVLRFRRFLALTPALRDRRETLAGASFALGYSDQAHLTRECVRLSGLTPARLVAYWAGAPGVPTSQS